MEKYKNIDPDYVPQSLDEWSNLMKYNKKAFNVALDKKAALDKEKKRIEKLIAKAECGIANIAGDVENPTQWWVCKHEDLPKASAAEQLIIDELMLYNVVWHREVEFAGLKLSQYGYARFDIWLPAYNTIIEYDGAWAHSKPEQIAKDRLKDKFCKDNNIRIHRWSSKHYYHIAHHVKELMKEYGIKKKSR